MLGCDVNSHAGLAVQAERQALWQGQARGSERREAGSRARPGSLRWRLQGRVAPLNKQAVMSWEPLGSLMNTNAIRSVLSLLRFSLT